MIAHEKVCWRNPNRFCARCQNTGKIVVDMDESGRDLTEDCDFCSMFDAAMLPPIQVIS